MGMDGLFRPSQALGYLDSLGHLNAADRAALHHKNAHSVDHSEKVQSIGREEKEEEQGQGKKRRPPEPEKDTQFEDELKELMITRYNIVFKDNVVYRFNYNEETDTIELIDTSMQCVIFRLSPLEFIHATENLYSNGGIMTDRRA